MVPLFFEGAIPEAGKLLIPSGMIDTAGSRHMVAKATQKPASVAAT